MHRSSAYVQKHQDPLQLRTARDRRRDPRGFAAVREKSERLQQAVESERRRIPCGRRTDSRSLQEASGLARDKRGSEKPRGRGRQGAGARRPEVRADLALKTSTNSARAGYRGNLFGREDV